MEKTHKHIHFVGIKGVGMAALSAIATQAGIRVSGSDIGETFITDAFLMSLKIEIMNGFSKDHVDDADLVITTGAHGGYQNEEVIYAKEQGIPVLTQGEAVGLFMKGELFVKRKQTGISVSGSHGKTTTTGMVATILKSAGYDPSYVVGTGDVPSLAGPGHLGNGSYVVVEADEYATEPHTNKKAKLLWQDPRILVLTNIDFDHPDMYESIDDVQKVFSEFVQTRNSTDIIIACGDDPRVQEVIKHARAHVITFGYSPQNTYHITKTTISESHMFLSIEKEGVAIGDFFIRTPGKHNGLNALAAIVTGIEIGVPVDQVREGIKAFHGSKRRMERVGNLVSGAVVYDDYAHHPREIQETLKAFRHMYPKKRLVVFFQPHTYSRTKSLFDEFVSVFSYADTIGLLDVFSSKRESIDTTVSSQHLVTSLTLQNKDAVYLPRASDVLEYIHQKQPNSQEVLLFMGAGDIYKIIEKLDFERK